MTVAVCTAVARCLGAGKLSAKLSRRFQGKGSERRGINRSFSLKEPTAGRRKGVLELAHVTVCCTAFLEGLKLWNAWENHPHLQPGHVLYPKGFQLPWQLGQPRLVNMTWLMVSGSSTQAPPEFSWMKDPLGTHDAAEKHGWTMRAKFKRREPELECATSDLARVAVKEMLPSRCYCSVQMS